MALTFLIASTVLQAVAMLLTLRVAVRRRLPGWIFIAVALVLMLARRLISLHGAVILGRAGDPVAELIALLISTLLVAGLLLLLRARRTLDGDSDDLDGQSLAAIERVKRQAVILAVIALLGASALIGIAYHDSRQAITEKLSRGSMDLARMLEASAELAGSRGADGLEVVAELWREARSVYPENYLCVIGADGRLLLHTLRPDSVGRFVGNTAIPAADSAFPATVGELVRAERDWVGRNRNSLGEEQIAAYAYSRALNALVAVHVPAAGVDARLRATAMPWALGFAGILVVVLPVSLGLLYRASTSSQAAAENAAARRRESEDRYQRIVETAHEGIWMIDAGNRTTFVNARMATMLGWSVPEMMGRIVFDFLDDDGRAQAVARIERWRQGIAEVHEIRFRRKDGVPLWASLSTAPVRDAGGNYAGALAMVTDITARRQLEEQVRHTQKMDAIGQLAGGVAHDFNNLLTVITGSVALLQRGVTHPSERAAYEQEILDAAQRAANLTRQLLTFSRKQVMHLAVVDLNAIVSRMSRLLQRILGEDIRLETGFAPTLPAIEADSGMLEQIVMNLAVNARDAMPRGGLLRLTTGVMEVHAGTLPHPDTRPGQFVFLEVSDTGTGIPAEQLPHIFEPFFTTKEVGKGTGLGLATVYGIAQQHRGWVTVNSEVGQGALFRVCLPACPDRPLDPVRTSPAVGSLPGGHETILVVEDDPAVRPMVERILRRCGYSVLTAATGRTAQDVWETHRSEIDLVLSDVVMPDGMSGWDLADWLHQQQPNLPIVLTSGYDRDFAGRTSDESGAVTFLQKPYLPDVLARVVRAQLDRR